MSEKRFTLHLPIDEKEGTMGYIVDKCNKTTYFIRGENARKDLVNLLNGLAEENEQLKQKIQRWKNLYELKDAEVTARVDALNRVCEYYTSEVLFKSDVDPNKAVQEVINEILNTEVKW